MATDDAARLEAQGDLEKALSAYAGGQRWASAARVALQLNRPREAARYFMEAQQPYDAAVCFQKAGAPQECLEALLRVPANSPRYRTACVHAIRVALTLPEGQGRLSPFVVPFINSAPASPAEVAAQLQMAHAFAGGGKGRLARSLYAQVLAADPTNADAKEALAALPTEEEAPPRPASMPPRATPGPMPAVRPPSSISPPPGSGPRSGKVQSIPPNAARPASLERPARSQKLADLLVATGKITTAQLQLVQQRPGVSASEFLLGEALVAEGFCSDIEVVRALSEQSGQPYISEERLLATASEEAVKLVPVEKAERWRVVPIVVVDRHLYVAMRDPRDFHQIDQIRFLSGTSQVSGVFATELSIRKAIRQFYYGERQVEAAPEGWHDRVLDAVSLQEAQTPFADRYTGTREKEFDTQEMVSLGVRPDKVRPPDTLAMTAMATPAAQPGAAGKVGTVFANRYRIEAVLGEGGSASVVRAIDLELNEPVAIKLFRPWMQTETLLARFKLELSLSRQLSHPNIIRLFDLGAHEGSHYLTMELLEGTDLGSRLASQGRPLPIIEGLKLLEQACLGLQAAHERGVIHRDIKPQNLFVTREGVVKVMDFGIAKKEHVPGVTVEGMMAGTPEYMSPEQINGFSNVTHQTDLYSLGATAYALFTGAPPFNQPNLMAVLMAHANTPPVPPSQRNPAIPPALEAAILRLLEKDPAKRFASCRELGETLKAIRMDLELRGR